MGSSKRRRRKKPGPKPLPAAAARRRRLVVKLTEREGELLDQAVAAGGYPSMSQYVRQVAIEPLLLVLEETDTSGV